MPFDLFYKVEDQLLIDICGISVDLKETSEEVQAHQGKA
jgi:hypothetical protein